MSELESPQADSLQEQPGKLTRNDLMVLTKFRLSVLVVVTTFVGFWLNRGSKIDLHLLMHTLIGSTLAAFGASVFNQLMEIEPDKRMKRTADRPLPAKRIEPSVAFAMGWLLSAFALIHLAKMVNTESAVLCALTLGIYLFISKYGNITILGNKDTLQFNI